MLISSIGLGLDNPLFFVLTVLVIILGIGTYSIEKEKFNNEN